MTISESIPLTVESLPRDLVVEWYSYGGHRTQFANPDGQLSGTQGYVLYWFTQKLG